MEKEIKWLRERFGGDFQDRDLGFWRTDKFRVVISSETGETEWAGMPTP